MRTRLIRFWFLCLTFRDHARNLNRRATVEQILLDIANGKRRPLALPEYRLLAFYLAGAEDALPKKEL